MKVSAHHNEVRPLIKEGYEKVYKALQSRLEGDDMIFAQWRAGFGDVLEWVLPADAAWYSYAQADPIDRQNVIAEYNRVRSLADEKLGRNQKLIDNVFAVPAEQYVYYTLTPDGCYRVMLAAWGYAFPTTAPATLLSYSADPEAQPITVRFLDNGQPAAGVAFELVRPGGLRPLSYRADDKGEYCLGLLPPGTSMQLRVADIGRQYPLTVVPGKNFYTYDVTVQPAVQPPVHDVAEPEKPQEPEKPEEPEEIIEGPQRDITVRFLTSDGQPVTRREVVLEANGRRQAEGIDADGYIYLDSRDIPMSVPVAVSIPGQTEMPPFEMVFDPGETQYEVMFSRRETSNVLPTVLLCLACAAATGLAVWGICGIDF